MALVPMYLEPVARIDMLLTGGVGSVEIMDPTEAISLLVAPIFAASGSGSSDASNLRTALASIALSGHRVVYITANKAAYASSDTPVKARAAIGITTGAASQDALATIQTSGTMVESSWTWTEGAIYLGPNGVLTQTAPTSGCLVEVGYATKPTEMEIRIQPAINLL